MNNPYQHTTYQYRYELSNILKTKQQKKKTTDSLICIHFDPQIAMEYLTF